MHIRMSEMPSGIISNMFMKLEDRLFYSPILRELRCRLNWPGNSLRRILKKRISCGRIWSQFITLDGERRKRSLRNIRTWSRQKGQTIPEFWSALTVKLRKLMIRSFSEKVQNTFQLIRSTGRRTTQEQMHPKTLEPSWQMRKGKSNLNRQLFAGLISMIRSVMRWRLMI